MFKIKTKKEYAVDSNIYLTMTFSFNVSVFLFSICFLILSNFQSAVWKRNRLLIRTVSGQLKTDISCHWMVAD